VTRQLRYADEKTRCFGILVVGAAWWAVFPVPGILRDGHDVTSSERRPDVGQAAAPCPSGPMDATVWGQLRGRYGWGRVSCRHPARSRRRRVAPSHRGTLMRSGQAGRQQCGCPTSSSCLNGSWKVSTDRIRIGNARAVEVRSHATTECGANSKTALGRRRSVIGADGLTLDVPRRRRAEHAEPTGLRASWQRMPSLVHTSRQTRRADDCRRARKRWRGAGRRVGCAVVRFDLP